MPKGLTLFDYSDRELLHIIDEEANQEGWTSTSDIAVRIGLTSDKPNQNAGIRLGWMKRYGAVRKHPEKPGLWALTPVGRALKDGDISSEEITMLDGMSTAQMLMVTRYLTRRYQRVGMTATHLMSREWRRGTVRRNGAG